MNFSTNCSEFADIPLPTYGQLMDALGDFGLGMVITGCIVTPLLWIGYFVHIYKLFQRVPAKRWRHLSWLVSFPVVFTTLSLANLLVPRSYLFFDTIKLTYFPFLMVHLIDLTLLIGGGQTACIDQLKGKHRRVNFCWPFCCCCGLCLRQVPYSKKTFMFLKTMIYQNPLVQLLFMSLFILFDEAELMEKNFEDPIYLVLTLFYYFFFGVGMWGSYVLMGGFSTVSDWKRYRIKATLSSVAVVLLKGQNGLFVLLEGTGVIPCIPPYVSTIALRTTFEAVCSILEGPIYALIFYFVYWEPAKSEIEQEEASKQN